jgi:hypothetical protein
MICSVWTGLSTLTTSVTYDHGNPFPMLLSARSQLELLSIVAEAARIIKDNAGVHTDRFPERVRIIDKTLIKATYGTRSTQLKELFRGLPPSTLRSTSDADHDLLTSKNVLSRIDKLCKMIPSRNWKEDYERFCEYVHPNLGMNMLRVVTSPLDKRLLRFSLTSREPLDRALDASSEVMAQAARETLRAMATVQPPFGLGAVYRIRW